METETQSASAELRLLNLLELCDATSRYPELPSEVFRMPGLTNHFDNQDDLDNHGHLCFNENKCKHPVCNLQDCGWIGPLLTDLSEYQ